MSKDKPNLDGFSVGLLLRSDHVHDRQIAFGVVEYHRTNRDLRIVGEDFRPMISWTRLSDFCGDGLVAIANSEEQLQQLKDSKIPFVLAGSRFLDPNLTVVASDNHEIGRQAGSHLISCGLKEFLYIGSRKWDDERLRLDGFQSVLTASGFACAISDFDEKGAGASKGNERSRESIQKLAALLARSKSPLGVFCPNSVAARKVLLAADSVGVTVPDHLAILAVNNDPLLCETTDPPLSSVVQNSIRIGFLAAQSLFEKLTGNKVRSFMVAPKRVSVRRSSDLLMVGNSVVEKALRFMRDHVHSVIEIADIVKHVGVSRRTLELRFRESLKSSPHQELMRMRLELAKSLLLESEVSITKIALSSGFGSSQMFSTVFKKQLGMTPTQYRGQETNATG